MSLLFAVLALFFAVLYATGFAGQGAALLAVVCAIVACASSPWLRR